MTLRAEGVSAGYHGRTVLNRVDLSVQPGVITGLTGPSGSGKSTLARVLALLQPCSGGSVTIDGRPVTGSGYRAAVRSRQQIGLVFQSPRAAVDPRWPLHRIVAEALRRRGTRRAGVDAEVRALADRFQLGDDLLTRFPHQVSDGQLQRACLARAVALDPRYLILDEATSMLDPSTTARIVHLVRDLAEHGTGVLVVSHDRSLLSRWAEVTRDLHELGAVAGNDRALSSLVPGPG